MGARWRGAKKVVGGGVKEGVRRGVAERVSRRVGGNSGGVSSGGSSGGGPRVNFGQVIFILIILLLVVVGFLYGYADQAGYVGTKIRTAFEPAVDAMKDVGRFFLGGVEQTREVLRNPEATVSLSGDYKESKKTGLELEDIKLIRGLDYNLLKGDLVFGSDVIVNQFPEEVERFEVGVECYLDDVKGLVSTGVGYGEEKKIIDIVPPREDDSRKIYVECLIPKESIDLDPGYNSKNARFDLEYLRDDLYNTAERVTLDVFIISRDAYFGIGKFEGNDPYSGRLNDAFKELMSGVYRKYRNKISSEMPFRGDVEARMGFYEQPLVPIDQPHTFFFMFKNNPSKGNVTLRGFEVNFPPEINPESCEYLDYGRFREEYFEEVNKRLNDFGKSSTYSCEVYVYEPGQIGDLIKLDPNEGLSARFEYSLTISKSKMIEINTKKEE